jgi:hypothetical protein
MHVSEAARDTTILHLSLLLDGYSLLKHPLRCVCALELQTKRELYLSRGSGTHRSRIYCADYLPESVRG